MSEEIIKKISTEERLAWTARTHMATLVIRGETIFAPLIGAEKYKEINTEVYGEGGKIMYPMVKDAFNIPVEDAIGAANLVDVVSNVAMSTEFESERVEESPERTVVRTTKCPWMELYKEYNVDPKYIPCYEGHQAWSERGLKAINPKLTFKMVKGMPKGDPYCEYVYEFKK
ncbi:MAG: L-2-amino-thiazoline-4-carboxylic acid hydrolase [Promethearchaeota archaeon]